ncbi:hypothetical protein [Cognatishimia sp.]|uniref:hypothetical protein n=1 Tax=Cognatishimia sp. TaxID=2211648 RepID=UPI003512EDB9|nr:hypothetical protein [Cognatishimia sp.]
MDIQKFKEDLIEDLQSQISADICEDHQRLKKVFKHAVDEAVDNNNPAFMEAIFECERLPVTIEEFLTNPDYLGKNTYWPSIHRDMKKLCPDTWAGERHPTEVILTGAIGTAKTFKTNIALCYTLYFLTCFKNPHNLFGLIKDKPLFLGCTAGNTKTARDNVYEVVKNMFLSMPYIDKCGIIYNKDKDSELEIGKTKHIKFAVFPPDLTKIQGYDLIAASIEEVNTMAVIQHSKKVASEEGGMGVFDQAERVINEALVRRQSRFPMIKNRVDIGGIYIVSSANHENDYTSKALRKMQQLGKRPEQLVFNYRTWDALPPNRYSSETFPVLVGTKDYSGKILSPEELENKQYPVEARIEHVPLNYLPDFERDFNKAQRDILGVSNASTNVFIGKPEFLNVAMSRYKESKIKYYLDRKNYDLGVHAMPRVIVENLPSGKDRQVPRIAHIDLALSGDYCGVTVSRSLGKQANTLLDKDGKKIVQEVPIFLCEFSISFKASKGVEIDLEKVVDFVILLKKEHNLNIVKFSFDQWQSVFAIQRIRKLGFQADTFSTKDTPESYEFFKDLLYHERIILPRNDLLFDEAINLQKDEKTQKIDHAPGKHNDIIDSVVASVYQLTTARVIRASASFIEDKEKTRRKTERRSVRNVNNRALD